jgi:hypothetical protein
MIAPSAAEEIATRGLAKCVLEPEDQALFSVRQALGLTTSDGLNS